MSVFKTTIVYNLLSLWIVTNNPLSLATDYMLIVACYAANNNRNNNSTTNNMTLNNSENNRSSSSRVSCANSSCSGGGDIWMQGKKSEFEWNNSVYDYYSLSYL